MYNHLLRLTIYGQCEWYFIDTDMGKIKQYWRESNNRKCVEAAMLTKGFASTNINTHPFWSWFKIESPKGSYWNL